MVVEMDKWKNWRGMRVGQAKSRGWKEDDLWEEGALS